jgi:hypothetical protein
MVSEFAPPVLALGDTKIEITLDQSSSVQSGDKITPKWSRRA